MKAQVITIRSKNSKTLSNVTISNTSEEHIITPIVDNISSKNKDNNLKINADKPLPMIIKQLPTGVKGDYINDYPIINIHELIRTLFSGLSGKIPEMKKSIKNLIFQLNNNSYISIEYEKKIKQIKDIEDRIEELESGSRWNKYISSVLPLLEEYIPLMTDEVKGVIVIGNKNIIDKFTQEEKFRRLLLISEYIDIAKEYINIDIIHNPDIESRCPCCDILTNEMYVDDEYGVIICDCGYEKENLSKVVSWENSANINGGNRSNYLDLDTFKKAWYRQQGKCSDVIPESIINILDKYYISKGYHPSSYFKNLPNHPINGRKEGTSIALLKEGLQNTGNQAYYNVINIVGNIYWGWILPDYKDVEEQVFEDYYKTQIVYNEIKDRDSSLNINIRMYLHLRAVDFPTTLLDFKTLFSRDSLEYHQECWKKMTEKTGIKYVNLI
jgi:hypothetical protein